MPYDNASSATFTGTTSASWSHVNSASADRFMFVGASHDAGGGGFTSPSVTYAGAACTELFNDVTNGGVVSLLLAKKVAPASGSNTAAVSWSDSMTGVAFATSRTGIDQTTPHGAEDRVTGSAFPITHTHASSAGKEVVGIAIQADGATDCTANGDNTERLDANGGTGQPGVFISDAAGAASVDMGVDGIANPEWRSSVYSLNPAGPSVVYIVQNMQIG
jgi:hypothetical protein